MWRLRERRVRAVTLIEVLVASVVAAALGGVMLDLLVTMRRNCERSQDLLIMQGQARLASDTAVSILEASVRPSALDPAAGNAPLAFTHDRCSVISSKNFDRENLYLWTIRNETIRNEKDPATARGRIEWTTSVFDAERMSGTPSLRTGSAGQNIERFSTAIAFSYATRIDSVASDVFRDALTEKGEYPKMIRVEVTVEDSKKLLKPCKRIASVRMP